MFQDSKVVCFLKNLRNSIHKFQNLTTNLKSRACEQILVPKIKYLLLLGKVLSEY